jgi:hypothetical protein
VLMYNRRLGESTKGQAEAESYPAGIQMDLLLLDCR